MHLKDLYTSYRYKITRFLFQQIIRCTAKVEQALGPALNLMIYYLYCLSAFTNSKIFYIGCNCSVQSIKLSMLHVFSLKHLKDFQKCGKVIQSSETPEHFRRY